MERITLTLRDGSTVSALVDVPSSATAGYVFAHGAGAGMEHAFMAVFADGLAARGIATLRYQFPFMEQGGRRVDAPAVAHAAVRAAVDMARRAMPGLPLFAGGKSFGGRMTSQAQAIAPLPDVRGLVFVGFPLHPADKPSTARADHLAQVACPMLFLQGTRDALADAGLMRDVIERLGPHAAVRWFADADHAFHVRKASGTDDVAVRDAMLDAMVAWIGKQAS